MTGDAVTLAATAAAKKYDFLRKSPVGYLVHSALAGVYVGFGIILIFAIGAPLSAAGSPFVKLAMGASFGIALSLVIFAGSELFTGNNMVMTIGTLKRTVGGKALAAVWVLSFAGNMVGSLGLAWLVAESGALGGAPQLEFIANTAATKMNLPASELFVRGILCNWLVCLAVWSTFRAQGDGPKLVMVFWCLFAFIAAGFEHSVANMTLLGIALLQEHPDTVTWGGFAFNLTWVTLGNVVGGGLFVGGAYWLGNTELRLPSVSTANVEAAARPMPETDGA